MRCRSCGTEIADKALICFKCGTATTEAKYAPVAAPRGTRRARLVLLLVLLTLLAVAAWFAVR